MLDSQVCTSLVACVITARPLVFRGKIVRKLRFVIGKYLGNLDRRSQFQTPQKVDAAIVRHIAINVHEHPARSASHPRF